MPTKRGVPNETLCSIHTGFSHKVIHAYTSTTTYHIIYDSKYKDTTLFDSPLMIVLIATLILVCVAASIAKEAQ